MDLSTSSEVEAYLLRYLRARRMRKPGPEPPKDLLERLDGEKAAHLEHHIRRVQAIVACEARERSRQRRGSGGGVAHGSELAPGSLELGDYRLLEPLGSGRFGTVYKAADRRLPGRYVAVKIIRDAIPDTRLDDGRWEMIFGEAKKSAILDHPNIVRYLDHGIVAAGTNERRAFIAMELIDGETLDGRIKRDLQEIDTRKVRGSNGAPSWKQYQRQMAGLVFQIAEATHAAHVGRPDRGLLGCQHCDIKPQNIVINTLGKPYLTDFGLARDHGAHGATGGTKGYMAPEMRVPGYPVSPAMDVYALGATLHHCLFGKPPDDQTDDAVKPPPRIRPVDMDLDAIRRKCLHPRPAERYQTVRGMADDLRRWLDGRPIAARPVGPWDKAWRWGRRRPAIAGLMTALAATVLIGFVVLFGLYRTAESARKDAERNMEIASALIDSSEQMAVHTFRRWRPLDPAQWDQWDQSAGLLLEQSARVRSVRGLKPELVYPLSKVTAFVAGRLYLAGRIDGSLHRANEWIDLLRECRQRDPGNEVYYWDTVKALAVLGRFEGEASQSEKAIEYFDQSASMALSAPSDNIARPEVAWLCQAFLQLGDRLAKAGRLHETKHVGDLLLRLLARFDNEGPDRPGRVLFQACLLADFGQRDRARGLLRSLGSQKFSLPEGQWEREAVDAGIREWSAREVRHYVEASAVDGRIAGPGALEHAVDGIVGLVAQVRTSPEMKALALRGRMEEVIITTVMRQSATSAASQRGARQLDDADRTVASLMALCKGW